MFAASNAHKERSASQVSVEHAEELRRYKEGEIFVDQETGKRYRVHKTMLPMHMVGGPTGKGDPDDRTLRRMEADVIIPNLMNKEVEQVECRLECRDLVDCLKAEGDIAGKVFGGCKSLLDTFNKCKKKMFDDPEFRQKITERYLNEREAYRRAGKSEGERKFDEYKQWKQQHEPPQGAKQE